MKLIRIDDEKQVELERVDLEPTCYESGRATRYADVNILLGEQRFNNLALRVETDQYGEYLDFSKTKFKYFGKVAL